MSEAEEQEFLVFRYVTERGMVYFARGPEMVSDVEPLVRGDVALAQTRGDPITDVAYLLCTEERYHELPNRRESERLFPRDLVE
jgi:hypothetical protein